MESQWTINGKLTESRFQPCFIPKSRVSPEVIMSYDDIIFISYLCITFITLFEYLTLYHVSNFES